MGFEVPPAPVPASRLGRSALAVTAGLILVVGVALATQVAPVPPASPAASASPAPTLVAVAPTPTAEPSRALPAQVACRQLDDKTCRGFAQAALDVLPGDAPPVIRVTVYRSLLCRDDLDCPPGRLASSGTPSGSVIVGFADGGPDAWVDVVTPRPSSPPGAIPAPPLLDAWIIR